MQAPSDFSVIKTILFISILLLAAGIQMVNAEGMPIAQDNYGKYLTDRLIIVCEYDSPPLMIGESQNGSVVSGFDSIDILCQKYNVTRIEPFYPGKLKHPELAREVSRIYIFHFDETSDLQTMISDFSADTQIEFAERYSIPDPYYTPNDPDIAQQWHLAHTQAYQAWDIVRGDTTRHAIIGIVDTGVYWDHPDLAANIWINDAEDVNHNGILDSADNDDIDADSNGYPDDVVGWDFGGPDNNPAEISPFHGTGVAGCASEVTDNGINGASIGYAARLMCVKVTNNQNQLTFAYQGIIYSADNGASIINCSWGSTTYSEANQNIIDAVYAVGVSVIAAASRHDDLSYPADYVHVLSVGMTDPYDYIDGIGSMIDIFAPGVNITTTWGRTGMITLSGSSLSSPMVCGLAALIKCWYPDYSPDSIGAVITNSADSIGNINPSYPYSIRLNCNNWLLTGIDEAPNSTPDKFTLLENYPNPFNSQTEIRFILPAENEVNIVLYDIMGRRVRNYECGILPAGYNAVRIDGYSKSSGVYIYQVNAGAFSASRKCLQLK